MGEGWRLRPAGGATGEAYVAEQGKQKIFVKRNSSPFLAVLSAEGIVPKLLWTKRLENGDVITAQQWISGRELTVEEMNQDRTAGLLAKIHRSNELLAMFKRMGNTPLYPEEIVQKLERQNDSDTDIKRHLDHIRTLMPSVQEETYVVCHADVHHNNWIEDDQGSLFLIDWDGAQVADPALDLAPLLYGYVPKEHWADWLDRYGAEPSNSLRHRIWWYRLIQCLENILWFRSVGQEAEELEWQYQLEKAWASAPD
ncbi:phosphotransferase [Alkalicoccus urumqiensis]|uniref:Phosphotransferase n=2 Tax=Alkalicoccus urumqiensis TaxID=1548213 RepID=A0A2P6MGZ0_ALKUR|nr:phosphotransferase family protein [Alkalicoccus urumqiensis]PRO65500.1 phosphotransferase [Alkalicoccus urumqiensis]